MTDQQIIASENTPLQRRWSIGVAVISILMWVLAVVLPVWDTRSDTSGAWAAVYGAIPAMIGLLGLLVGCPAWLANIILLPIYLVLLHRSRGFWLSVLAFGVAATSYGLSAVYGDNETAVIVSRRLGFYLWLASFFVLVVGTAILADIRSERGALARWLVIAILIGGIFGLELLYPVGVSPLERSLKNPDDLAAFNQTLARNPSQKDKDAALWWTVCYDDWERRTEPSVQMEKLIAAGANPNQTNRYGTSLLSIALCSRDNPRVIELLVRAGVDVNARDGRGKTALDTAEEIHCSPAVIQVLKNAGAKSGQP